MMQDVKDSLKHLRGIHLVFVLASVAISMAIFGSDSIYETAADQLRDVVRLTAALDGETIVTSISDASEVPYADDNLEAFIKQSLSEYFEAMNITVESVKADYFRVDLGSEEQYGHQSNIEYMDELDTPDPNYWFKRRRCLLGDGTELYTRLDELQLLSAISSNTLRNFSSNLNQLLKADTLYVAPVFNASYLSMGGPIETRHNDQWKVIRENLEAMNEIELTLRNLSAVEFTDSTSRSVFKTAEAHAEDDPIAYEDYNFKFDTLTVSIYASYRTVAGDDKSKSFELKLPVMFRPRQADFMVDTLQQDRFDPALYSRYLAGARTFDRLFPDLAKVTTNLRSASAEDLERYLEEQARSSGAPISLLGMQIRRDLIEVWGVLLMLCVQLYFCMHYRALLRRLPENEELSFPWIGLYRDPVSTIAFLVSIALPFCVCLILAFMPDEQSTLQPLEIIWLLVALVLMGWATALYVSYRRGVPRH